jgi:hypothetical protein
MFLLLISLIDCFETKMPYVEVRDMSNWQDTVESALLTVKNQSQIKHLLLLSNLLNADSASQKIARWKVNHESYGIFSY